MFCLSQSIKIWLRIIIFCFQGNLCNFFSTQKIPIASSIQKRVYYLSVLSAGMTFEQIRTNKLHTSWRTNNAVAIYIFNNLTNDLYWRTLTVWAWKHLSAETYVLERNVSIPFAFSKTSGWGWKTLVWTGYQQWGWTNTGRLEYIWSWAYITFSLSV